MTPVLPPPGLALVLSGGGARAAYQAGVLAALGRLMPDLRFPIITGVSAGAINALFLASHPAGLGEASIDLLSLWRRIRTKDVVKSAPWWLARNVSQWSHRLLSGGLPPNREVRGLLDTAPLAKLLRSELGTIDNEIPGLERNLAAGRLQAVALTSLNYNTGETITWVQGQEPTTGDRPMPGGRSARLTVDHVLASAALPFLFPAVRLADGWHGDGGVRLATPLQPAVYLGASRILAITTRGENNRPVEEVPSRRYPPPAQIAGKLMNAIFLDVLDHDAMRLERINSLLRELPEEKRQGLREVACRVMRPTAHLARLASRYEPELPPGLRFLVRGLGAKETKSPDFLSMLMFQPDYIRHLIDLGEEDFANRAEEIVGFLR